MFKSFYNHLFHSEKTVSELTPFTIVNKDDFCGNKFNIIPEKWMLFSLGQSPGFAEWHCVLLKLTDETDENGRSLTVKSEDCDNPLDAIQQAIKKIGK